MFKKAWLDAIVPANVCSGFKKAGVYPFDSKAVPVSSEPPDNIDKDAKDGHGKLHSHSYNNM